jgi:hypothetical protein
MQDLYNVVLKISDGVVETDKKAIDEIIATALDHITKNVEMKVTHAALVGHREAYLWVSSKTYKVHGMDIWSLIDMSQELKNYISEQSILNLESRIINSLSPFEVVLKDFEEGYFAISVRWNCGQDTKQPMEED